MPTIYLVVRSDKVVQYNVVTGTKRDLGSHQLLKDSDGNVVGRRVAGLAGFLPVSNSFREAQINLLKAYRKRGIGGMTPSRRTVSPPTLESVDASPGYLVAAGNPRNSGRPHLERSARYLSLRVPGSLVLLGESEKTQ